MQGKLLCSCTPAPFDFFPVLSVSVQTFYHFIQAGHLAEVVPKQQKEEGNLDEAGDSCNHS